MDEIRPSQPAADTDPEAALVDDVEGHGLREVAVGVAAAGMISGGGVAAAAMHGGPTTPIGGPASSVVTDATHMTQHTGAGAVGLAGTASHDVGALEMDSAKTAYGATSPTVNRAGQVTHRLGSIAGTEVTDLQRITANTAAGATTFARGEVRGTVDFAEADVAQANTTVKQTNRTASNDVASADTEVTYTAISVLSYARSATGDWTMTVHVAGAGAAASGPSPLSTNPAGTVRLTDATGHLLASAKLSNGTAKFHFSGVHLNQTLTVHYAGNTTFFPSTTHATLR